GKHERGSLSAARREGSQCGKMPSEIFLRDGRAPMLRHLPLGRDRTLMQFPTPANMTALSECLADSKPFARCSVAGSGLNIRLNSWCSRRKSRHALESGAWG